MESFNHQPESFEPAPVYRLETLRRLRSFRLQREAAEREIYRDYDKGVPPILRIVDSNFIPQDTSKQTYTDDYSL